MCIGNIVTKKKITFDSLICKCKSISEIDKTNPTLIIGWDEVKSIYGNDISILEKQIDENIFWTFNKTERRNDYERDINKFYCFIIKNLVNNVKYHLINVLTIKYSSAKRLIDFINSDIVKHIYIDNNRFIFIYYNNTVCGISLDCLRYVNIDTNKVIKKIKKNPNNHLIDNDLFLSIKLRRIIGDDKMIIPYLHSII